MRDTARAAARPFGDRLWPVEISRSYTRFVANEVTSALRHDLLNRLTALGALGFQLKKNLERRLKVDEMKEADEIWEIFPLLTNQIGQASRLFERTFLHAPAETPPPCDLFRVATELLTRAAARKRVKAVKTGDAPFEVRIDPAELEVALCCLLDNAVDAVGPDAKEGVELRCLRRPDGSPAVALYDTGPGLDAATTERVFDRFFTTKPGRMGLGLNVARSIAFRWNADLEIANRTDGARGACAALVFRPV